MIDFAAARRMMVDGQLRTSDVTDPRIIAAMLELPREKFLPEQVAPLAYLDRDLPATAAPEGAPGRCLIKPMVLAKMIQAATIGAGDHVLDVGCASGYSSAVLARLARSVVALEADAALAQRAAETLPSMGTANVTVVTGSMLEGWPGLAPYDVIVLNGATEVRPSALIGQLTNGGRLVGVFGRAPAVKAMLWRVDAGEVSSRPIFDAAAPLLPSFVQTAAFVF